MLIIEPGRIERNYWADVWRYRELFYFLAWRDILVRYKQTAVGIVWSVLRPIAAMVVFTIVFGRLARFPSDGTPYPILVFAAMLPWQFFAGSLSESGNSLVDNAGMLTKVYFPRIVVPASSIIVSLVDFIISLAILGTLVLWYGVLPGWRIFTLPLFFMMAAVTSFGFSLWLAALNVRYRDFRYVIPFIVQLGLYISPVGFSSSVVPAKWRLVYSINPMVGVIDGFRWAIIGSESGIYWPGFLLSGCLAVLVLVSGFRYFRRTERVLADII